MSNPSEDIVTNIEASESDVLDLKKAHYQGGGGTRTPAPVQVQTRLHNELLNMLKVGKRYNQFQGIDRCIRLIDPGSPSQHHCMAMMVKNMSTNTVMCSSCDRIRDVNANPHTINSSAIKLSPKELDEMNMTVDPLETAKLTITPVKKVKVMKPVQRRPKMAVPNVVKIEISMKELEQNPDVIDVLLQKALEAIYDLPITKFSEAELIRGTSEKIKKLLAHTELQGD